MSIECLRIGEDRWGGEMASSSVMGGFKARPVDAQVQVGKGSGVSPSGGGVGSPNLVSINGMKNLNISTTSCNGNNHDSSISRSHPIQNSSDSSETTAAATATTTHRATTATAAPANAPDPSSHSAHRILHTHRQNHNSSKLPAFRFADLKKESLSLPGPPSLLQLQHMPLSPVSPNTNPSKIHIRHAATDSDSTDDTGHHPNPNYLQQAGTSGQDAARQHYQCQKQHQHQLHQQQQTPEERPLALQAQGHPQQQQQQQQEPQHPQQAPPSLSPHQHQFLSSTSQHHDGNAAATKAIINKTIISQQQPREKSVSAQSTLAPASATASASASVCTRSVSSSTISHRNSNSSSPDANTIKSPNQFRARASTFQAASALESTDTGVSFQRPASFPNSPTNRVKTTNNSTQPTTDAKPPPLSSTATLVLNSHQQRRPQAAAVAAVLSSQPPPSSSAAREPVHRFPTRAETGSDAPPSLSTTRLSAVENAHGSQPTSNPTKEWAQGQRELLLPKALQDDQTDDRKRHKSRPPVSFRPPRNDGVAVRVPPIRSFRSSGSRKSWTQEMTTKPARSVDEGSGDDSTDPNHHDRALRALEGRSNDDGYSQMTPPDSADATPDGDSTGDIFMRIAHEDPTRRLPDEDRQLDDPSAVSRITRVSRRRPLSAAVPSYQATSPPQMTRRLSDQRETARTRRAMHEQPTQQMTRELTYRAITREKPSQPEDIGRPRLAGSALKSSPITPRSPGPHDVVDGPSTYGKRRPSVPDNSPLPSRASSFKTTYGQSRTYNSSPLVPRQTEPQAHEVNHSTAVEGTESSASTAAPSTVWDELDDIRSRIHRLELTGKGPASGAAMSRVSDDRPPTATTNATTMSGSPKRGSSNQPADASSTTSSQREQLPILLSALSKSKPLIAAEAYEALEMAATEALALSQMMGAPGQPGPVSSGASTIGVGTGVTDRQLRRKADSICRSLTTFCLALADDAGQRKNSAAAANTPRETEPFLLISPTAKCFPSSVSVINQRRPTTVADSAGLSRINTAVAVSPRAMGRTDERKTALLSAGGLASPRYAMPLSATAPSVDPITPGRKSSLLIARTRRAGTEEPEESSGRKASLLVRTRRAGTEEPADEGRKTSFLLRGQRAYTEEDEEPRPRAPSRATTELGLLRHATREYIVQQPSQQQQRQQFQVSQQQQQQQEQQQQQSVTIDASGPTNSGLPRRRLVPSALNSRLIAPNQATSFTGRRYLDRSTPERDSAATGNVMVEKLVEDRGQRHMSLGQTTLLNRTNNNTTRRRESSIPSLTSGTTSTTHVGGYR